MSTFSSNISTTTTNFFKGVECHGGIMVLNRFHWNRPLWALPRRNRQGWKKSTLVLTVKPPSGAEWGLNSWKYLENPKNAFNSVISSRNWLQLGITSLYDLLNIMQIRYSRLRKFYFFRLFSASHKGGPFWKCRKKQNFLNLEYRICMMFRRSYKEMLC